MRRMKFGNFFATRRPVEGCGGGVERLDMPVRPDIDFRCDNGLQIQDPRSVGPWISLDVAGKKCGRCFSHY